MEQTLDDIAAGQAASTPYLKQFYLGKEGLDEQVRSHEENIDPREACTIELDGLTSKVRVGKFGPYLVKEQDGVQLTASLPVEMGPAEITNEIADQLIEQKKQGPKAIGMHPETGLPIFSMSGRFGPYLQLGEAGPEGEKPKRVSIPKNIEPANITFEQALGLISLPRTLGDHPESAKPVKAGIGRFGPYVFHEGKFKSLPKTLDVMTVDLVTAVELLKQARTRGGATPLRELGPHPEDAQPVQVFEGKYGPYVKHGKINATIPKETPVEEVTLEQAIDLLNARAARGGIKKARPGRKAAGPAPKAAAKKTPPKKAAPKKAAKKKSPKKGTGKKAPNKKKEDEED
jgi:DNA topoisomerase-1